MNEALEHGLERYEQRHPKARGMIQGSVVVLQNRDGRILAETGGRQLFNGRSASYSDYNRVTRSLRQPGSAMKPIVYLAAFRHGGFTLETLVPDEPISVPNGDGASAEMDLELRRPIQGPDPDPSSARRVQKRGGHVDHRANRDRQRSADLAESRRPDTACALPHDGAGCVRNEPPGAGQCVPHDGLGHRCRAVRDPRRRARFGRGGGRCRRGPSPTSIDAAALSLIQEGLRGVVRLPTGTAHALASRGFPIAVMGKTGTTNEFRDAIFVGSTYGPDGITAAVRIGFDDNRSLGSRETGGRLALPVFQELMLGRVPRQDRRGRAGVSGPDGRAHHGLPAAAQSSCDDRRRRRCRQTAPYLPQLVPTRVLF